MKQIIRVCPQSNRLCLAKTKTGKPHIEFQEKVTEDVWKEVAKMPIIKSGI